MSAAPGPVIRQDLSLSQGEPDADGSPAWILHDDLSGRYFRLGREQMELLAWIDGRPLEEIARQASRETGSELSLDELREFIEFLRFNNLVEVDRAQHLWLERQKARTPGWLSRLGKSYLFFRIPLLRPDAFLTRALPWLRWLGTTATLQFFVFTGIVALFLTLREFESFKATFLYFFNLKGALVFALALTLVKLLHELGHAFAAKACGCRVPVMGVAFIVMWPVLYTDTTDAWRVNSRRKRLLIDAAGVLVELGVAVLALFAWNFTPDGALRSVLFVLASSTWIVSLGVNLNPLMRFDGYYLLSDLWRMPNLEQRSHALARWWLREQLFGLGEAPPETPRGKLIVYAICVWIYRFLLFTGIALLVYHMFFKTLGIALFLIEIVYFILAPVYREARQWHRRRERIGWNRRTRRTALALAALLLACLVPWRGGITVPAIQQASYQMMFAPADGELERLPVVAGQSVPPGGLLYSMRSDELNHALDRARRRLQELEWQQQSSGLDADLREHFLVTVSELQSQKKRIASLQRELERLTVYADETVQVSDMAPDIRESMWLASGEPLFAVVKHARPELLAYLPEAELHRIEPGMRGSFYPAAGGRAPIEVEVVEVEDFPMREMEQLYTSSVFGGDVPVRETADGALIPEEATYRLRLRPLGETGSERVLKGDVVLSGRPESFAGRAWKALAAVLLRESGF